MCLFVYVWQCLCVCRLVCWSIISKSYWLILMKLGRMMYNENISVPFKDEINWFGRTHTLAIWDVKIVLSYKVLEKHITSLGPLKLSIPFKNCTYIYYILLLHDTTPLHHPKDVLYLLKGILNPCTPPLLPCTFPCTYFLYPRDHQPL